MAIGIVRALVGETTATDSRGNTRVLRVGDAVELNETVQSSVGSTILIQFDNGGFATVGSGDKLFLDQSVIDPTGATQPVQTAGGNEQSVEDIQAMIAAGMDPTQIAEATAAGADAGTAGDPGQGAHTFVVVNQEAARAEVTPGLATDTFGSTQNMAATRTGAVQPQFLINPDEVDEVGEAVNNGPVINLEASIASGQVREAGVRGDDATLAGDNPNAAYDGNQIASGQIVATDPDGDALSFAVKPAGTEGEGGASADGQYGSLTIDANGNYVYSLDDRANGLSQGESVSETFTVMVSDGRGGLVEQEITITVNGTNDAPTLSMSWENDNNSVSEDMAGSGMVSGNWSVSDADSDGNRQTISIEGKDGTAGTNGEKVAGEIADGNALSYETDYGKLTLNPDGTYSYELKNDSEAVQKMGEGETRTETFEITTTDAHGSTHTQTITVVVTGTNDAPVISEYGNNLTLKEAGVVGNNQEVPGNDTAGDSFTVRDVDANDSLSATVTGEAITGQTSDPATGVMTVETEYGTLTVTPTVNGDGSVTYDYHFKLNGNANSLSEGQDIDYRFDINVSDGKGGTVSYPVDVSIAGTNDAPTLTAKWGDGGNSVTEDDAGNNTVSGEWSVTDADSDGGRQTISIKGAKDTTGSGVEGQTGGDKAGEATYTTEYGKLTVNPDGTFTFELDNTSKAVQGLGNKETHTETFEITTTDAHGATHTQTIEVVITGTNDAPKMSFDSVHVKEEGEYRGHDTTGVGGNDGFISQDHHRTVVQGDLSRKASDADVSDKLTYSVSIKSGDKNLESASTGGQVIKDENGNDVKVHVEATSTTENGIQTIVTNYGTLVLDTNTGKYTFTLSGDAADRLAAGEFLNLAFNTTVTDPSGASSSHILRVTVEGSNDAPVLSKPEVVDVYQAGNEHFVEGKVVGSDVDHGAKLTYSFGTDSEGNPITEIQTAHGTVTINPETGEYTYTLKPGTSPGDVTDEFRVRVTDEHGAYDEENVSVNIHGNRAPEIVNAPEDADGLVVKESGQAIKGNGVPDNGWAQGENQTKVPGIKSDGDSFTVKDADKGDKLTATLTDENGHPLSGAVTDAQTGVITLVTEYGTLTVTPTLNGDGSVTYDYQFVINDAGKANSLHQGEQLPLDFYIKVSDSSGASVTQEVTVTIEGTNDAPKVSGTQVHVKESGVYDGNHQTGEDGKNNGNMFEQDHRTTVTGKVPVADPDNDAVVTLKASLSDAKNPVNETNSAVFTGDKLTSDSATGATEKVVVDKMYMTHEEGNGHDIQVIETNYGILRLDTVTGEYSFTLDSSAANHLAAGEKFVINFRVTATDEFKAQGYNDFAINLTVEGANDAPTLSVGNGLGISGDTIADVDGNISVTGKAEGADIDRGAKLSYSVSLSEDGAHDNAVQGKYGKLVIDSNGNYKYILDTTSEAYKGLEGKEASETFFVRVTDEHGAYSELPISVEVTGPTPPVLTDHVTVNEAGLNDVANTSEFASIKLPQNYEVVKPENGNYEGKYGQLVLNNEGQWEYRLDKAFDHKSDPNNPANTAENADTITIRVKGSDGIVRDMTVTVDIIDDVPEVRVTENGSTVNDAGEMLFQGSVAIDYGADGSSGSTDIHVRFAGEDAGIFRVINGQLISNSVTLFANDRTEVGTLELSVGKDGHYDYVFKPAPGYENTQIKIDLSVSDHDGDTGTGTIVIEPPVTPPENHAPEFGGAKADVDIVSTTATEMTSGDRILAGKLTGNSHTEGVSEYKGDPNDQHAIFKEHNNGVSFDEAVSSGKSVSTVAEYLELINSENCPDLIVLGGSHTFIIGEDFRIPEGVTLIVNGNLEIENGAKFNTSGGQDTVFDGLLYVNGNMDVSHGSFHIGAGPHILVKGEFDWQGSIKVDGQVETTVKTSHAEVQIDLNDAFSDPDNDSLSFSYDRGTLPDAYEIVIENGVLKIIGAEGSSFGTQTVIVTADDGHGGSTSASLTITVNSDSETGTVVMGPPVLPPATDNGLPEVPDVNHAPDIGDVSATVTVDHKSITINAGGTHGVTDNSAIIVGKVENGNGSISGVKVDGADTGHLFDKYIDADPGTVKDSAHRVDSLGEYKLLMESGNAPKVIILGNGVDSFSLPNDFKVPEGTILIIDGNINVNGAATLLNEPFAGMLYVTGDLNVPNGSLTVYNQYGSGFMLVEGSLNYQGAIHAMGNNIWQNPPHVTTSIDTDSTRVEMNLNGAFKDADGDKLTFTIDNSSLSDGVSIVNGVLTIIGKDGVALGHQTITVTATDDKGASTSVSFEFNVNGNQVEVTASPVDHTATASYDTMMLSSMDTGAEHVTDAITHQPLDGNHHADTVDGMIAAADTIEHGTAGHDMLTGSHGHDVLYGEGGHDLMVGDGNGTTVDTLAGLVHTDSSSESVLNTIHSMSPEQLKGLSDGLEALEHHNDGNDLLMGDTGHDVLIGMGGHDVLHGGAGNDILFGGSGNDTLIGGHGDNILTGGSGNDTFKYNAGDLTGKTHGDTITDFHVGDVAKDSNADILDLKDLLTGADKLQGGASDLISGGYLQFEDIKQNADGSVTVKLSIDVNGHEGGADFHDVATITMNGVHLGNDPGQHAQELLNQLVQNNEIKI